MNKVTQAYFCPKCSSPSVEFGTLMLAGEAEPSVCNACGWKGKKSELLSSPVVHDMGSNNQIVNHFVNDFRTFFAKEAGIPIAQWLMKWGFLPADDKRKQSIFLARYITVIARASIVAILEERKAIEKERVNAC